MPKISNSGGVIVSKYMTELKKTEKSYTNVQTSMSSGKVKEDLLSPLAALKGQEIKSKLSDLKTLSHSCLDASYVCHSITDSISSGINILTEQIQSIANANTDVSGANNKNIMDLTFQSALTTFEEVIKRVKWNNTEILTGTGSNVTPMNPQGIYSNGLAATSDSSAFNLGAGTANVSSFHEILGSVNGAVQSVSATGDVIDLVIGTQTFSVDINGLSLNQGDVLTLSDMTNNNNTISFVIGSSSPSANQIASGISSIMSGMVFSPTIANVNPVQNYFTGGINYTYTTGNYTGTAQNVFVEQVGNQFQVTLSIAQSGDNVQFFKANITNPQPGSALVFNGLTNPSNALAFNFAQNLTTPFSLSGLQSAFESLLGINGIASTFSAMSVSPYSDMTINANGGAAFGTYGLTYTALSTTSSTFTLNTGNQSFQTIVELPLKDNTAVHFPNGISLTIDNASAFAQNTSKGQMLFKVGASQTQNVLHFQTGRTSLEQTSITCPSLSLNALNLEGVNIRTSQNAQNALMVVQQAIQTLSNELGRIANVSKNMEETILRFEEENISLKTLEQEYTGTDLVEALVKSTQDITKSNILYSGLAKEMEKQQKTLELLERMS
ncbi:MAG: hypothetical protein KBD31_02630 [Proteobacteria bacterium]|nr:hypothetical protein [Pseudomonadota bacterium]